MWRRLLAACHPDRGGDHELFLWVNETLREHVAGEALDPPQRSYDRPRRTTAADDARVPFPGDVGHDVLTARALDLAGSGAIPGAYARLLEMLADCHASHHGRLLSEQRQGASYKRLAAIGHLRDFDQEARVAFYRIAEEVPLSDRHASFILDKLKGGA